MIFLTPFSEGGLVTLLDFVLAIFYLPTKFDIKPKRGLIDTVAWPSPKDSAFFLMDAGSLRPTGRSNMAARFRPRPTDKKRIDKCGQYARNGSRQLAARIPTGRKGCRQLAAGIPTRRNGCRQLAARIPTRRNGCRRLSASIPTARTVGRLLPSSKKEKETLPGIPPSPAPPHS